MSDEMMDDAAFLKYGPLRKPTPAIAAPPKEDDALPHAERVEKDRPSYPSLYCAVWPDLVPLARSLGYALAIHGSLSRDLDLIAVPWTEEAVGPDALVKAVADKFGAWVGSPDLGPVTRKPHGRMGAILLLGGHAVVDLSIMPRLPTRPAGTGGAEAVRTGPGAATAAEVRAAALAAVEQERDEARSLLGQAVAFLRPNEDNPLIVNVVLAPLCERIDAHLAAARSGVAGLTPGHERREVCGWCGGAGIDPGRPGPGSTCPTCHGVGFASAIGVARTAGRTAT